MKTVNAKRITALLLSMVVIMSMCLAGTASAFADSEGTSRFVESAALDFGTAEAEPEAEDFLEVPFSDVSNVKGVAQEGATIKAENMNKSEGTVYSTPETSSSKDFSYTIKMPKAGTLVLKYIAINNEGEVEDNFSESVIGSGVSYKDGMTASDGTKIRMYSAEIAGEAYVKFSINPPFGPTKIYFTALYAPYAISTVKAPSGAFSQVYYLGGPADNSTVKKFKVSVPANGYLVMDINGENEFPVSMKTSGFRGFETITSDNIRRVVGVKKGIYTFSVKSHAAVYSYRLRFYKVAEKNCSKKGKAVTLKKKKASKGVIITNSKKAHWYKFKNPKLQKVTIATTSKLNGGGSYGGIRVTTYNKKGEIGSRIITSDIASSSFDLYTVGKNNKLSKGNYWIKIESYKGGNGYFTVKWK